MKLPSIIRLPRNRSFDYQPIYYNPEKEAKEERFKRILSENNKKVTYDKNYDHRIAKAFQESRKHKANDIGIMQAILILILLATAIAYWYIGTASLWIMFLGVAAVYLWLRRKMIAKNRILKAKKQRFN
ncbi:MAG: hypothetical protein ACFB0B_04800 [Thermonemataceae bacterium]